jgi:predicted CoA-substrate-specific enzyme activase
MIADACRMGIDIGSTTVKILILDAAGETLYSEYRRHNTETLVTLQAMLEGAVQAIGSLPVSLLVTGSAGLGITEKYDLPFIQEVVASAEVVHQRFPQVRTLIDIGGEDAKIIFFDEQRRPDIRMNGSCAGGTGAFLDEMATLVNVPVTELDQLACQAANIYPMASRCGVFAKTDLQNLLSRQVTKPDIAASVFHAVVLQTLATLARGRDPEPAILFSGGPLTFMPSLRQAFLKVLELRPEQVVEARSLELLPALGAAVAESSLRRTLTLQDLLARLRVANHQELALQNRHPALFESQAAYLRWKGNGNNQRIQRLNPEECADIDYFLGIDSGSTTTKLVLIDEQGRVACDYYTSNAGNSIRAVQQGLARIREQFASQGFLPRINHSVVTGYGEDLIRAAFGIDAGMVETLAHFQAARAFDPQVSFILDIGGQDMKAIFIKDGQIQNIEINEACSSGCGSFIETFARSMGYGVADFAQLACMATAPYNLGTRCTVFMNSRVKQALREGTPINDISAGLAFSVIKNALHKVLKITNTDVLGERIVVQGGTFRNPAIHKALEELIGKPVVCPELAELMGAYGAALQAREAQRSNGHSPSSFVGLVNVEQIGEYVRKEIHCHGCENRCRVTKLTFPNKNSFYSGNRCERIYSNGGRAERKGISVPALKYKLLFERQTSPQTEPDLTIGIPRVLNQFENFPFWSTLFVECGFQVRLSAPSSNAIYQAGAKHIMSENLCFPGKLVSGHIMDLIQAGVQRIFYPMVFYEQPEFSDAQNSFNCPVVSGYPEVIRSAIDPLRAYGIPLDMPAITFRHMDLLEQGCLKYLTGLGVPARQIRGALRKALRAQREFKAQVAGLGEELLADARMEGRPVVLLMGRPYHIDPLINHHIPDLLTDLGMDVLTEDAIPLEEGQALDNRHVMTQWEYVNRYYHAARWVGSQENVELVQLNSFGCGPDAFILDEVRAILAETGKHPTVIRIDEIESAGSTRLRLRSMMESLKQRHQDTPLARTPRKRTKTFQAEDRIRTILVPDISPYCSPPITRPFQDMGFHIEQLPPPSHATVDVGLKYTNNEICYPGIICLGDLVSALQSGTYDLERTAVGFSQTGGQCRATSIPAMIKKALLAAGIENVPVVTLSTSLSTLNDQPGLNFDIKEYSYKAALGMMFTDALSDMYQSTLIREKQKGSAWGVAEKYLQAYNDGSISVTKAAVLEALEQAVTDFNGIETHHGRYPGVGIVGEIYVKYNSFSNNHVAQWLVEQGLEVHLPSFFEFFAGGLVSLQNGVRTHVKKRDAMWLVAVLGQRLVQYFLRQFDTVRQGYRYYRPHHDIWDVAERAKEILSLNHQYGEGWLIAGEIASLARQGVNNVLCLQPFGCIANHVIAKGVQKRLQERFPQLNLLFLDADAGVSEVNFYNRLHFFVNHAKTAFNASAMQDFPELRNS